ncbi:DinB family protein [Paenibacillus thiaminolyticus]|uniref:DinB family protein n=1 Tax=Paenibacillus thiaminolyticus TaxID=49283 RepID=UPI003D2A3EB8
MDKNMNITDILVRFDEITEHYVRELDKYSMEELRHKPAENEWSLGQMYLHLAHSALNMQLRLAEQCMAPGGGSEGEGEKTEAGRAVFEQGSFPPVRIQVPASAQYTPPQPESKEQLAAKLEEARRRMHEIGASLQGVASDRLQRTAAHPAFGALNAAEWFAMPEMHYRHHLLQKERLDSFLHPVSEA